MTKQKSMEWSDPHLWWDGALMIALWVLTIFVPKFYEGIPLAAALRILALIATLEMGSFLTYKLIGKSKSLLLQGFIGGLASSTTVFVQMTSGDRFKKVNPLKLASALLLATLAMLIESFFIALGLTAPTILLFTILLQCSVLIYFITNYWKKVSETETSHISQFEINHPIVWKRVLKLSIFIAFLIGMMSFVTTQLKIPDWLTVLLTSLFEAHAVLASTLLKQTETSVTSLYVLISLGHIFSKMFLVWRSKITGLLQKVLIPLISTVAIALMMSIIGRFI